MKCIRLLGLSLALGAASAFTPHLLAQEPTAAQAVRMIGPYAVLAFDSTVLQDAMVDAEGNVFLKLQPDHSEREITVKISMAKGAQYRKWFHDSYDLVSPANVGRAVNGWTDRVQTSANFIEYWMDGKLFLHLGKPEA